MTIQELERVAEPDPAICDQSSQENRLPNAHSVPKAQGPLTSTLTAKKTRKQVSILKAVNMRS